MLVQTEYPKDDLGRINQEIDKILANHLLQNVSSLSHENDQSSFRMFLMDLTKEVADFYIRLGIESGVFEDVYNKVLESNFIFGRELDQKVAAINFEDTFPDMKVHVLNLIENQVPVSIQRSGLREGIADEFKERLISSLKRNNLNSREGLSVSQKCSAVMIQNN